MDVVTIRTINEVIPKLSFIRYIAEIGPFDR